MSSLALPDYGNISPSHMQRWSSYVVTSLIIFTKAITARLVQLGHNNNNDNVINIIYNYWHNNMQRLVVPYRSVLE